MKKVRVIIAVVAVALMVMGIGYAAWSQTTPLNIDGTTTHMDVQYSNYWVDSSPYVSTAMTLNNDKKTMNVKISNLYPDASSTFTTVITNYGTMPVILKSLKFIPRDGSWWDLNEANLAVIVSTESPAYSFWLVPETEQPNIRLEPGASVSFKYTVEMSNLVIGNALSDESFSFDLIPYFETIAD